MKKYENFHKNGFEIIEFNSINLNLILEDIVNGNLKSGFSLQKNILTLLI